MKDWIDYVPGGDVNLMMKWCCGVMKLQDLGAYGWRGASPDQDGVVDEDGWMWDVRWTSSFQSKEKGGHRRLLELWMKWGGDGDEWGQMEMEDAWDGGCVTLGWTGLFPFMVINWTNRKLDRQPDQLWCSPWLSYKAKLE